MHKRLIQANYDFELNRLTQLPYDRFTVAYQYLIETLTDTHKLQQLKALRHDKRREVYPVLNEPHYYPPIKAFDHLTHDERMRLDCYLNEHEVNSVLFAQGYSFYKANLPKDKMPVIINYLIETGIIALYYRVACVCGQSAHYLIPEEYMLYEERFKTTCISTKTLSDKALKKFTHKPYSTLYVGCFDCEGHDIKTLGDLKDHSTKCYKLIAPADRTSDSW